MAVGKCARAIKTFVSFANRTPAAKEIMEGWDRTIQFNLDGEDPMYVKIENGKASFHEGKAEPNLVFRGNSELFYKVITNEIDPEEAFVSRKYEVQGPITDATKFRRLGEAVQASHTRTFGLLRKFSKILEVFSQGK